MSDLQTTAPAFLELATRIVYCSMATVDRQGRPRTRVVHPVWFWDGERLEGWVGSEVTPMKAAHLERTPFVSCGYFTSETHDECAAECRARLYTDDATCTTIWERIKGVPPPLGYDPAIVPQWRDGPHSPAFGAIRLDPWRLRVRRLMTGEEHTWTA